MYQLKNKVVVVTGAGSGIGRALAGQLAAKGCRLALADNNAEALTQTASNLSGDVLTQVLDVADRTAVYAFADKVREHYGTAHVVINNAGVTVAQSIENLSYDDFEWLMNINFWGVVYGTKAFLPTFTAQNEGAVVNVSSVFGIISVPCQGAYNASKFAVRGFTEALRHELRGTQVKAISIHPGGIRTDIVRNGRIQTDHKGRSNKPQLEAEFERAARTTPDQAAAVIIDGIERGKPRVLIGADARAIDRVQRLLPVSYWGVLSKLIDRMTR